MYLTRIQSWLSALPLEKDSVFLVTCLTHCLPSSRILKEWQLCPQFLLPGLLKPNETKRKLTEMPKGNFWVSSSIAFLQSYSCFIPLTLFCLAVLVCKLGTYVQKHFVVVCPLLSPHLARWKSSGQELKFILEPLSRKCTAQYLVDKLFDLLSMAKHWLLSGISHYPYRWILWLTPGHYWDVWEVFCMAESELVE